MPRTSILDLRLLEKLAQKRGYPGDIKKMRSLVSSYANSNHVSPPVALVFLCKQYKLGTASYEKTFDPIQKGQLREMRSKQPISTVSTKTTQKARSQKSILKLIDYNTSSAFKKGHIDELNRAYTYGCYTSTFILARKIIENLIIDILKMKYPENERANKEIYFNIEQRRYHDFEVILKNFKNKKHEFGTEITAVERLCNLAGALKDDANKKTHSWYHLVRRKKEIDDLDLTSIIDLIETLERFVGIR